MSVEGMESQAFYRATLKSESHRIVGVLVLLGAMLGYTVARGVTVDGFGLLWLQTAVIALSTLRVRPGLTALTGIMSALGYLCVVFYVDANFPTSRLEPAAFPLKFYIVYASTILASGLVAAIVGHQIRGYVSAALQEAE